MNDHHHHTNGGFLNSFFWGALIGAGVVFFLSTKRGKEITKELSEKGLSILDDLEGVFSEIEEDTGLESPSLPPVNPVTQPTSPVISHGEGQSSIENATHDTRVTNGNGNANGNGETSATPTHIEALQSHGRRLFSGIPKRR